VSEAIIMINDGIPYIKGKHIVLDGDTIVDGSFTVTDTMISDEAVVNKLKASGIDARDVRIVNLDVDSITGGDLDLSKGFRITYKGQSILSIVDGKVSISAQNIATDEDEVHIEVTPGPQGLHGRQGPKGVQGLPGLE